MSVTHNYSSELIPKAQKNVPKQLPRYGMNILQAVAIGNSTDIIVLMMTSSIDIIRATDHKIHVTNNSPI